MYALYFFLFLYNIIGESAELSVRVVSRLNFAPAILLEL